MIGGMERYFQIARCFRELSWEARRSPVKPGMTANSLPQLSMPRGSALIIPRGSASTWWDFLEQNSRLALNSRPEAYRDILPDKWSKECGWLKTPKGPHQRCEMPLIRAADLEQLDKPASQKYWDPKDLTNQWKAHNVQEGVGYATE